MGKEQENQKSIQEEARTAVKGLAFSLPRLRAELKEKDISPRERFYLEALRDETVRSIIELRNQFFPDKTLKEILSSKEKNKNQSSQT